MLRGNGGHEIFFDAEDRYHLYLLLQEGISRYGHRIHGFCCMPNHLHLAVQAAEVPLSKIMQNLSFRYTRWINKRQKRIGHLFQGRYKAILVDRDSYLLELVRYIHLNPVRARLVRDPAAYRWSGHRAYLGREDIPWLTTDTVLSQLAHTASAARRRYMAFIEAGKGEGHRPEFHGGAEDTRVLGNDRFVEKVIGIGTVIDRKTPPISLAQLVKGVCRTCGVKERDLTGPSRERTLSEARALLAWLALEHRVANLVEIGAHVNRDASTLSRAVSRLEAARRTDNAMARRMRKLESAVMQA